MLYCWQWDFHPVQPLLGGLGCEQLGKTPYRQKKLVTVPGHFCLPGQFCHSHVLLVADTNLARILTPPAPGVVTAYRSH